MAVVRVQNHKITDSRHKTGRVQAVGFSFFAYLCRMGNEKAIASRLLQIDAVKLDPEHPFTWASGWKSPVYCDNRKALSFPYTRDFIKSELCNLIFEQFPDTDLVAGVATAGIAWGAMAADQLKLPFVYVRAKPKEHGLGNQIEGYFEKGQRTVVVEDLVSTGKSSLQVVQALLEAGLEVVGMVSIFTYGFATAAKAIQDSGIRYFALTNYETLVQLALEKGTVSPQQELILLNWSSNPSQWQGVL